MTLHGPGEFTANESAVRLVVAFYSAARTRAVTLVRD